MFEKGGGGGVLSIYIQTDNYFEEREEEGWGESEKGQKKEN